MKNGAALHLLKQPEEPKNEDKGPTMNPGENTLALPRPFKPKSASKTKNAVGGRRKSLKRLDSAKEGRDLNLDFLPLDLESVPSGLDFLPKNLDFLHPAGGVGPSTGPRSWAEWSRERPAAATPQIRSLIGLAMISIPIRRWGDGRRPASLGTTDDLLSRFI
jgi:hypothetical protein